MRAVPAPDSPDTEPDDAALIARWRAGDERAATELVARHADALARYAVHLGLQDDVEDLVQDTFARAFGSLDGFRGESTLRTWLFTIERRLLLDRRRSEQRRGARHELPLGERDAVTEYDALDGLVAVETEARLRRAVAGLSTTQREVFTLRVAEGMSYGEIAEIAGTTEGAARVHYHNALRRVKEVIDE
ncbi:MAG: RNA polymerase sigma factor [Gemmatimonadaceae bacterium]